MNNRKVECEPNIKVEDEGRYEIPVLLKSKKLILSLGNLFWWAIVRTLAIVNHRNWLDDLQPLIIFRASKLFLLRTIKELNRFESLTWLKFA